MLFKSLLGFLVPYLAFLIRKTLPGDANDFGQSGMICLDFCGDMLALDERRTEENKGVGRPRNVVLWFLP